MPLPRGVARIGLGRGAAIGLLAGLGVGVVCLALCPARADDGANLAPAAGMLVGPLVGAVLLPALPPRERWTRVW